MRNIKATLAEAQRVAGLSRTDRLDGKHGEEAREVILRLLETTGLDYADALKLMSAVEWGKWNEGWNAGYQGGRETARTTKTMEV
jgi:hypothetical protein